MLYQLGQEYRLYYLSSLSPYPYALDKTQFRPYLLLPEISLMKMCHLADYPARKTMEAARRFSPVFCEKAAALILETDYRMKTSFDEPERLLELLILQLAQEAKNG